MHEHAFPQEAFVMSPLAALSVSIAVLGAVWAYLALGPLAGFVLIWAGFIGWGCYFHSGKALSKAIIGTACRALIGWIWLLIIVHVAMPGLGTLWPAIVVGVTVFFLVIVASVDVLSVVPANVYGYAAIVAYALTAASPGPLQNLTAVSFANPLILLIVSLVLGALFGYASGQLAEALTRKPH